MLLSNYVSLLYPLTAHHMEGVCQHPSFRAPGSGRGLPETLQTAGERPLWGDRLWQDLVPAKQVRAQNYVLVGAQTVSVGWAWYLVKTWACSSLRWLLWWFRAVQSNYPEPSFWIIEPLQKEGNAQSKHLAIQFSFTNICERTVISESSLNWRVVLNVGWGWCLCNTKVCGKSKREEISQSTFKGESQQHY